VIVHRGACSTARAFAEIRPLLGPLTAGKAAIRGPVSSREEQHRIDDRGSLRELWILSNADDERCDLLKHREPGKPSGSQTVHPGSSLPSAARDNTRRILSLDSTPQAH
jgi:hypothetical protein